MRIVIVEDEILIREGIVRLVNRIASAHEVVGEAANGREGLSAILTQKPDLVITDIRMPDMDGLEMLTLAQEHGCACPAIVLTAYSEFAYARQAVRLGVIEYLLKPIVVEDFIRALRQAEQLTLKRHAEPTRGLEALHSLRAVYRNSLEGVPVDHDVRAYLQTEYGVNADGPFTLALLSSGAPPTDSERVAAQALKRRLCQVNGDCARLMELEPGKWLAVVTAGTTLQLGSLLVETLGFTRFVASYATCAGLNALRATTLRIQERFDYSIVTGKPFSALEALPPEECLQPFIYPVAVEARMRAALWARDIAGVEQEFNAFFKTALYPAQPHSPHEIKECYVRLLWALLSNAKERGYPGAESLGRQTLLETAMSAFTRESLYAARDQVLAALRVPDATAMPTSEMVSRARMLIHEGYASGITLEEIAQKLCITAEYLSQQFHREVGVNYSAYMRALRIGKAKELLRTSDLRIYEIANRVGYPDAKYFSRVFKAETGCMPYAYRTAP